MQVIGQVCVFFVLDRDIIFRSYNIIHLLHMSNIKPDFQGDMHLYVSIQCITADET